MGVFSDLRKIGLEDGDTIYVASLEMTYTGEYD